MGEIGKLGSLITFEVSSSKILTPSDLELKASGSWSYHDIISQKPRSEFNGAELRSVSFTIVLSAEHGVKPRNTMDSIVKAVESGTVMELALGGKAIGNKWIIKEASNAFNIVLNRGEIAKLTIKITLEEYIMPVNKKSDKKATKTTKTTKKIKSKKNKKKRKKSKKKEKYKVGDIVNFKGGKHYVSSCKGAKGKTAKAGKAKITIINHNTHPYHLIHTSGSKSNVYGWVNSDSFD